ncbi:MAG: efflux RND transporter permease subunit [Planctomycetota bacterium]|nr:MAG: efflux RND transporter permease subunit [Planctomycetota bacterium]
MNIAAFGVRKPVPANLVMVALIAAGLVLGADLRREFFPETRPNEVVVTAPYPGASPDEIEEALAIKIEDRIEDLDDVKEYTTTVVEGAATIRVEFEDRVAIEDAVARVKREVDALQDLPERSERIVVTEFEPNIPVISVTLFGDADERVMKDAIREMRDDLRSLPGMGDIVVSGVRTDEIAVEVDPARLIEHGLSLPAIAGRIREGMTETPAGAVRTPSSNVTVRAVGAQEQAAEVRRVVVKAPPDGRPVLVGDVATVSESFADVDLRTRLNGRPAVSLTIFATGDQDVIDIASLVRAYVAGRQREPLRLTFGERFRLTLAGDRPGADPLPRVAAHALGSTRPVIPGARIRVHSDLARFVEQRLDLLARNALWGGILVFLTLLALLATRVALWVTAGLIISVLGTLAVMHLLGITLNFLTMFGLIVVLGLLVDDAIVVAENISAKHEAGEPALAAAVSGARQVEWPVVATVLTTIAAFLPLRAIEGRIGDLMGALPIVVACALGISLLESLLILPSHMGHSLRSAERRAQRRAARRRARLRRASKAADAPARTRIFDRLLLTPYTRLIDWCLRRRYLTVAVALGVLVGSFGLIAGGRVRFEFLASADAELIQVDLRMPVGTPIDRTDEAVARVEAVAGAMPEIETALTVVGARQDLDGAGGAQQSHLAQVYLELKPVEFRDRTSRELIDEMRRALGPIPGAESLRFVEAQGGPGGADISYAVAGDADERVLAVVEALEARLAEFAGVFGISNDADAGQRELRVALRPGAAELGFTTENLATQLRAAVFGLEAYTFAGDREDVDVRVRLTEPYRRSLARLESIDVFTPAGAPVPLAEVAAITEAEGYATVRRLNGRRAVTVTADVDRAVANPEEITAALAPTLASLGAQNPDVRIISRGRQEDLADSFRSLPMGMLGAIAMIYVILAWLFGSYIQPVAVLLAVPFATVGAIWGHLIMGFDMTILSLIGFVALTGIVVNDSLILMQFYNEKRVEHITMREALIATGRARLRAILLTTITTVLGLSPLMLEQSFQARFLIPMAITISFGLIAATALTLIVLPCILMIGRDAHALTHRLITGRPVRGDFVRWDDAVREPGGAV